MQTTPHRNQYGATEVSGLRFGNGALSRSVLRKFTNWRKYVLIKFDILIYAADVRIISFLLFCFKNFVYFNYFGDINEIHQMKR